MRSKSADFIIHHTVYIATTLPQCSVINIVLQKNIYIVTTTVQENHMYFVKLKEMTEKSRLHTMLEFRIPQLAEKSKNSFIHPDYPYKSLPRNSAA